MRPVLSSPFSALEPRYDAVVVGSGYGGGIAALRLAEAGKKVLLLERGRELHSDELPETSTEALSSVHVTGRVADRRIELGQRGSLFDWTVSDDLSVLTANGLGGTSLINANVFWAPDEALWGSPELPEALRNDRAGVMRGFERARSVLEPTAWSDDRRETRLSALLPRVRHERPALLVHQGPRRTTPEGVSEEPCTGCGNCVTGCRVGAKRTVDRTYLARAAKLGVTILTSLDVRWVERSGDDWIVAFRPEVPELERGAAESFVLAKIVVLSASVFGTTRILHRSRARGLALSDALGTQVSGNGNQVFVARDLGESTSRATSGEGAPGPCITAALHVEGESFEDALVVEDGVFPKALEPLVLWSSVAHEQRRDRSAIQGGVLGRFAAAARDVLATVVEHGVEAPRDLSLLLVQGHDGAGGTLSFDERADDIELSFFRFHERANTARTEALLASAAAARGGVIERARLPYASESALSVHPLGGCPMGDDAIVGVVDHLGRVFNPAEGISALHEGLFVLDASILPRSVGRNPVGTLTALVERACEQNFPAVLSPPRPEVVRRPKAVSATFSEAFHGWLAPALGSGEALGPDDGMTPLAEPVTVNLVVLVADVEAFLRDPDRAASAVGSLTCKALSPDPLSLVAGSIKLFSDDPNEPGVYFEHYELSLVDKRGKVLRFSAMKRFCDGDLVHVYADGTNLPFRIRGEGVDLSGLLQMFPRSLLGTIAKTRTHGAATLRERVTNGLRFRGYFAKRWIERVRGNP